MLPDRLRASFEAAARRWLQIPVGQRTAVHARLSASVLLLREGAEAPGIEVFMQHRAASMAFAPGVWVYPGGGVDPRDAEGEPHVATEREIRTEPPFPGRNVPQGADLLDMDAALARLVLCAAARELFEECGVLFAGRDATHLVSDLREHLWGTYRAAVLGRTMSMAQMLRQESLMLRADLLTPVARWITPECEPRRYDTFFFAARMPPGQRADGRATEAVSSHWVAAKAALAEHRAGPGTLMPPTQCLAAQMARAETVEQFLNEPRTLAPVLPQPVDLGDRMVMRAPIDAQGHALPADRTSPAGGD